MGTELGRMYQVRKRTGSSPRACVERGQYPAGMCRFAHFRLAILVISLGIAGCSSTPSPSFDPTGTCIVDGQVQGAYPDLEARIPSTLLGAKPTKVDSGRHCSTAALGSLAASGIKEIRFAGGTWSFGAERSAALAVFTAPGLTADDMAEFYLAGASAATRTQLLAGTAVTLAGRPGHRLDTQTGERLQTVEVWPSMTADMVNVVITNDLPDARIADAVAAFGGQ